MSSKPLPNPWFLLYFLSIIKSVSCLLFSTQTPQINTAKDYELKSLILSKTKPFPFFHLFSLLHWSQIWETKQHRGFGLVPIHVHSSPWQMPHGSGVSSIFGSRLQPKLHLHSFAYGLSSVSQGLLPGTSLTYVACPQWFSKTLEE